MSCGDAPRIVLCNLGNFDSFRLLSVKYGRGFPRTFAQRHMLLVRPRYEAVIAAAEEHVCFWANLTQVN